MKLENAKPYAERLILSFINLYMGLLEFVVIGTITSWIMLRLFLELETIVVEHTHTNTQSTNFFKLEFILSNDNIQKEMKDKYA